MLGNMSFVRQYSGQQASPPQELKFWEDLMHPSSSFCSVLFSCVLFCDDWSQWSHGRSLLSVWAKENSQFCSSSTFGYMTSLRRVFKWGVQKGLCSIFGNLYKSTLVSCHGCLECGTEELSFEWSLWYYGVMVLRFAFSTFTFCLGGIYPILQVPYVTASSPVQTPDLNAQCELPT